MRSITLSCVAAVVLLTMAAASATSASATAIKFEVGSIEGKSTKVTTWEVSDGKTVNCSTAELSGEATSEVHAHALALFKECTAKVSIVTAKCKSAGAPEGDIHVADVLMLLGSDSGVEEIPAVLLQASNPETGEQQPVKFSCSALGETDEWELEGSAVCSAKSESSHLLFDCEKGTNAGEPKHNVLWEEGKEGPVNKLEATVTGHEKFTDLEADQQGEIVVKRHRSTSLIKFTSTGTFESGGGEMRFEYSNGNVYSCKKTAIKGEVTAEIHATAVVLFEECGTKVGVGIERCETEGSPEGDIDIADLAVLLGSDSGTEDVPAVLFQPSNPDTGEPTAVSLRCSLLGSDTSVEWKGSLVCLIKNDTAETMQLKCERGAKSGEQRDRILWEEENQGPENKLLATAEGFKKFTDLETSLEFEALLKSVNRIQVET